LWKLDRIIIPWLCLLYLASFLDRTNIGNAKIDGLQKDLHMTSSQYNLTLTIFFISYSIFEPATQIMLKKFRPSIFLPIIMILWGIVMTTMGLVHNFSGLMACRWFLGITEAGLFPGVNYYLSAWYKRRELGIRAAIFFSAAALAGSFGGLLAAAISETYAPMNFRTTLTLFRSNERSGRKARLGLDFYPRRISNSPHWGCLILLCPRFPR
jgi:MFS family permease